MSAIFKEIDSCHAYDRYIRLVSYVGCHPMFPVRPLSASSEKQEDDMIRYLALGLAFLASVILTGCGGGGSSSTAGFLKVIFVPGVTTGTNFSFDISAVDGAKGRMYYTNRNSQSVDVIDIPTNTF